MRRITPLQKAQQEMRVDLVANNIVVNTQLRTVRRGDKIIYIPRYYTEEQCRVAFRILMQK